MKLYCMAGAISLATHIALREAEIPFELVLVDRPTHKIVGSGADYDAITAATLRVGATPALELDDGQFLSTAFPIFWYIAEKRPLAPARGTPEFYLFLEWQNFLSNEIKAGGIALLVRYKQLPEDLRKSIVDQVVENFAVVDKRMQESPFLLGASITILDYYLFVLTWASMVRHRIDLSGLPALQAYFRRLGARPAFRAAMEAEGLTPVA